MIDKLNGFVLSTGRTGTVSMARLLNSSENIYSIHEPTPSRRYYFYSRFYFEGKLKKTFIFKSYLKNRKILLDNIDEPNYIEVNPFFWSAGHIFNDKNKLKILHVVRDIEGYIKSRLNFGASGWYKYIIDYVPFYQVNVSKLYSDKEIKWGRLKKAEREAWIWCFINEKIEENKETHEYLRIRFEDLFLSSSEIKYQKLEEIKNFFGIDMDINLCLDLLDKKQNPSINRKINRFEDLRRKVKNNVYNISKPMRERYGYI